MTAAVKEEVALGCRVLGVEGQSDLVWGHVSVRDDDGRGAWMKPAGLGFEEVRADHVLLVSSDGEVVEGEGRRHSEYPIHTEIFAARADVRAVVHTHGAHTVAFAALGVPLRPVSHEATLFVPPDVARFTQTGDLILTPALGRAVASTHGDRNAVILVNHGLVTAAADVGTAVMTALILERACRTQLLAMAAGELRHWSGDEEARSKREHCYNTDLIKSAWDYLVRKVPA